MTQETTVSAGITYGVIQERARYSRFFAIAYGLLELADAIRALAGRSAE